MTYEMYRYLFIGAAIISAVLAVVAIVLFFVLDIHKVINDLTGRSARKAIEDIRRQNEASGDKTYKSSLVNRQRSKLTDKMSASGRIIPRDSSPFSTGAATEKISTDQLPYEPAGATTTLDQYAQPAYESAAEETSVLSAAAPSLSTETTVLQHREEEQNHGFVIEYEITYIHTSELIG